MNKKSKLGQFYSTNGEYIIGNLKKYIKEDYEIIDPFSGEWDLLNLFEKNSKEAYDIDPKNNKTIKQDILNYIPDYKNKWIITNPPYLSKNKSYDKKIYNKYKLDDLYKISLKTLKNSKGGIIIIPLNFLSSDSKKIRKWFFKHFNIIEINIFEEKVFNDTDYTVLSMFFEKENIETIINFYPNKKVMKYCFNEKNEFSFDGDLNSLPKSDIEVLRYTKNTKNKFISNLFVKCIDSGTKKGIIKMEIKEPFIGKDSDRSFITLCFNKEIPIEKQKVICEKFNTILNKKREKYNSLFLSQYRNSTKEMSRKRISFKQIYRIVKSLL